VAVERAGPAGARGAGGAEAGVGALDHQRPGTKPRCLGRPVLRGLRGTSGVEPSAATPARNSVSSDAPLAANTPGRASDGTRRTVNASRAGGGSRRSPPATAKASTGPPRSTMAARFEPCSRRSSRDGPPLRSRQGRLHVASVHGQEGLVDRARSVRRVEAVAVQPLEHPGGPPLAGAPLGGGRGAQRRRVERPPGAARAHDAPDRLHRAPRRHGWPPAPGPRRPRRQQRLRHRPQPVRQAPRPHARDPPSRHARIERAGGSDGRL
jgi:hypothetical protein